MCYLDDILMINLAVCVSLGMVWHSCEPADQCVYRYRFLDATLGESCRLKEEKKLVRPVYKSKLMAHPVSRTT